MDRNSLVQLHWIRLAIVAGLLVSLIYPSLIFFPLPRLLTVTLAGIMGPLLGMASVGLCVLLRLHRRSLTAELGALSNVVAGALITSMLLVQLAVRQAAGGLEAVTDQIVAVWLGMDVAWDLYIGLGTVCFALAMWRHPRFGLGFGLAGLLVAILMIGFNLYTFPEPPATSGLVDLGPLVGAWYLVVTIQAWRSLAWARSVLSMAPNHGTHLTA